MVQKTNQMYQHKKVDKARKSKGRHDSSFNAIAGNLTRRFVLVKILSLSFFSPSEIVHCIWMISINLTPLLTGAGAIIMFLKQKKTQDSVFSFNIMNTCQFTELLCTNTQAI